MSDKKVKKEMSEEGSSSSFFGLIRSLVILLLIGYLLWTFAKSNPKVQSLIDRFTASQTPAAPSSMINVSGQAMGTFWNVKVYDPIKGFGEEQLTGLVQTILNNIDGMMSTYKPESDLSEFNRSSSTDWISVSPELATVVNKALVLAEQTGGAFDPTIGPLVNLWRFGPDKEPLTALPSDEEIEATKARIGYKNLEVRLEDPALRKKIPDLYVDLSAIAKGFSVDMIATELEHFGFTSFMVEVGGETYCHGVKTKGGKETGKTDYSTWWTMGIEKPEKQSPGIASEGMTESSDFVPRFYRIVRVKDMAIATSGDAHNAMEIAGKRFSHIIDPVTGRPTEIQDDDSSAMDVGSVSVFNDSCATADAFATALFVLGPEKGIELANRLQLPVLYVLRSRDAKNPRYDEITSDAFKEIPSEKAEMIRRGN